MNFQCNFSKFEYSGIWRKSLTTAIFSLTHCTPIDFKYFSSETYPITNPGKIMMFSKLPMGLIKSRRCKALFLSRFLQAAENRTVIIIRILQTI